MFEMHQHGHRASECQMRKNKIQCQETSKFVSTNRNTSDFDSDFITLNCFSDDKAVRNENGSWIIYSGCTYVTSV